MSPLHSLTLSLKSSEENKDPVSPQLSPKRSYLSHGEGEFHCTEMDAKRRHLHSELDKRAPLGKCNIVTHILAATTSSSHQDPLTASGLQNRRPRAQARTSHDSNRSLKGSTSVPDFRSPLQQQLEGCYEMIYSSSSSEIQAHTWPPDSHTINIIHDSSSLRNHGKSSGGTGTCQNAVPPRDLNDSISPAWPPPVLHNTTISSISDCSVSHGWSPSAFTPGDGDDPVVFRSRSNSLPLVRRPPVDLWQSEPLESSITKHQSPFLSPPATNIHPPVQNVNSVLYNTPPPGLTSHSAKRRLASGTSHEGDSESVPLASADYSIGSSKTTNAMRGKPMAPIGAERSRVLSMLSKPTPKANLSRISPQSSSSFPSSSCTQSLVDRPPSGVSSAFPAHRHARVSGTQGRMPVEEDKLSTKELDRLFLCLRLNEHSPKTISPLSPLRNPQPDLVWSAQAKVMLRTSSLRNVMSARYRQSPNERSRTICDRYQPREVESISGHCQECRRDSMCKKLLSRRLCQSSWPSKVPRRSSGPIAVIGDYGEILDEEGDEEEGSLWDEVRAATLRQPSLMDDPEIVDMNILPPASPRILDLHDFDSELPEIPDEDLFSDSDEEMADYTSHRRSLF
ncbi:hypothetical protein SERLA73DRAFT_181479 [Serpula lacrymans var. lacrymans S7.3]|uniref:Uncharacterized protein n=2 Tax=Serpula lacrymans var. lacrymans TaxID=341189 RepID=F8PY57_SERL3|nr:uncharacterized protein SERLADRAFT_467645 [Serpula lacrymans var. lacrymans S7.9]EGN98820.1 hypothetical protein SERLA73DRAFT_181479 [Serpula lacrymans var. lacrymans S7.3]EGO24411.1 hypothetical protein SERLADRAFT_467645 [Serpula lacrymans var. lacrymans S7.9]